MESKSRIIHMGNPSLREGLGGRVRIISGRVTEFSCDAGECAIGIKSDGIVFNGTMGEEENIPNIVGFEVTGILPTFGNSIYELNAERVETAHAAD